MNKRDEMAYIVERIMFYEELAANYPGPTIDDIKYTLTCLDTVNALYQQLRNMKGDE